MGKYLVRTTINCNSKDDVTNKVFDSRDEAKDYFDDKVDELVQNYTEDTDNESLEDWLDPESGIIVNEYCGDVTDTCVAFDGNKIELMELIEG